MINVLTYINTNPPPPLQQRNTRPWVFNFLKMATPVTTCTKEQSNVGLIFEVWRCSRYWNSSQTICTELWQCFAAANRVWVDLNVPKWPNNCYWRRIITAFLHINDWKKHWKSSCDNSPSFVSPMNKWRMRRCTHGLAPSWEHFVVKAHKNLCNTATSLF